MGSWIVVPELDTINILTEYGRFLENDYRMIIEHLEVPDVFEEFVEKTHRKFVFVSDSDIPWVLAKSVYLCLKLAGPDSIVVKSNNLDETFMVQNILENHANDVKYKIFTAHHDELKLDNEWRDEIENSTDIIVFGDETMSRAFREYETVARRVWERGNKFSFGIIKAEYLTQSIINKICFDFFSFYGEGSLSPKFYFIVGKINKKIIKQFAMNMITMYGGMIQEYREKLPLTKKSDLVQKIVGVNYAAKYIRIGNLRTEDFFDKLYGDVRLVEVDDLEQVEDFIKDWQDNINTVATNVDDDMETLDLLEDRMVIRICDIGDMQFPEFFEQYDRVDDFMMFSGDDEEEYL